MKFEDKIIGDLFETGVKKVKIIGIHAWYQKS